MCPLNKKAKKNHVDVTCIFSALDGSYYITNQGASQDIYITISSPYAKT